MALDLKNYKKIINKKKTLVSSPLYHPTPLSENSHSLNPFAVKLLQDSSDQVS